MRSPHRPHNNTTHMQYETKHKLVFGSNKQVFSLRGVKSKKISSHPGRDVLKSVLKVGNA